MKRKRKRKCHGCGQLYLPDSRTRDRQRYCAQPPCRRKSHAESQRRWLAKPANRHYFCGPDQVERVRQWRAQHPGYWRRSALRGCALQDDCATKPIAAQPDSSRLTPVALQEDLLKQPTVLLGLVANLTGQTLQEDIALTLRQYHTRGQQILGLTPGTFFTGGRDVDQNRVVPRPTPSGAGAVQLGGSSTRAP